MEGFIVDEQDIREITLDTCSFPGSYPGPYCSTSHRVWHEAPYEIVTLLLHKIEDLEKEVVVRHESIAYVSSLLGKEEGRAINAEVKCVEARRKASYWREQAWLWNHQGIGKEEYYQMNPFDWETPEPLVTET